MAENPEDDFLASSAPVPAPRPTDPDAEYAYGIPDVQEMGIGTQFFNMFVPYRSRVVEPSTTEYIPLEELGMDSIRGEVMRKFTPGEYAEPEFGFSYMPAVQGIASFFSNPVESAKAAGEAILDLPKQQMLGAEAMMQGYDFGYDPETGQEYRYDPTLVPATTAAGTMISIAREGPGGQVLGIMAGRTAKDGPSNYDAAVKLYKEGKSEQEIFDAKKSYLDVDVLGTSRNYEDAFRFEIPTANSKLNDKEVFDGRMEGFRSVEVDDEYGSFSVNDAPYARLEQILDFPELYKQYPEVKDLRVARINSFGGAFYDPEKNFIGVADQLDNQKFQSALLHEVQHWVQHKEGFPSGGNAQSIAEQLAYRMDAEDPEMLKGPARDLYQSLYGETEARTVQRRFLDPEEAKLTPIVSRRKEAPDTDISLDMVDAIDRGEEALIDALEYGDISYSDIYPETFSGGSSQPLKKGSVGFYPSARMPIEKSIATPQDFEFYQDNPAVSRPDSGKERLESNIRFTEERYADTEPSMLRGPITANLGSRNTDMFLSTDELTQLPGAMGETRGPGDPNFDRLLEQIKTEGFDPDQAGNKVVVGVNHKGEAYLMEGNTRAAVAKELGIPNIKTEVRYWNGGEMIDGPYKPEAVAARAVVNKAEGGVVSLADVARNMNRGPRGVGSLAPVARNMYRTMVS